jgi:autotransporter-associated beta strand protein
MVAAGLTTLIFIPNPASAATVYWDLNADSTGAGGATPAGAWNASSTFWNPLADGTGTVAAWTAGDIAVFSAGSDATGAFTISVDGTQSIGGLRFEEGQVTLAGGTLAVAADSELFVAEGLVATVSSLFSGNARLTKTGAGTMVLSGESTGYTGALVVSEGTLRAVGPNTRALGAGTLQMNGGTLHLMNAGNITFGRNTTLNASSTIIADAITSGTVDTTFTLGTLNVASTATLTLNRGANITGAFYGRATFGAVSMTGDLTVNLGTVYSIMTLGTLSESVAGRSLTLNGFSNSTSILILNGASTLTGGFTINTGRVYASVANSLGPAGSTTTVNAGNLELRHVNAAAGTHLIYNNSATLSLTSNSTVNWNIGGGITHNGGTLTLTSGRLSSTNFDLRTHTLSTNLALNGNLVLNPGQETTLVLGGVISEMSGTRTVTKSGVGIARLDAAASYSGVTTISNGVLRLGVAGALPSGAGKGNLTMNPGTGLTAVLDLNGFNQTLNGLSSSGTGTSRIDNLSSTAATLTVGAADGAGVFAGALQSTGGTLNLVKTGTGTINLAGVNTQSGTITVNAGVLQFSKLTALYNGATGSWTVANLTINTGGTLALNVGGAGEFTSTDAVLLAALGTAGGGFQSGSFLGLDTTNAGGTFTFSPALANPNGGANALGLMKLGTGTLVLEGASTHTGGTVLAAGVLSINADANLGDAAGTLTLNSGTTLRVTGTGGLTMGRSITLPGAATFDLVEAGRTLTLSTDLAPGGVLTKTGAGTLRLTGDVTSNSGVVLGVGSLVIAGDVNTAAGVTTVGSAGNMGRLLLESGSVYTTTTLTLGGTNALGSLVIRGGQLNITTPTASAGISLGGAGYGGMFLSSGSVFTNRVDSIDGLTPAAIAVLQVSGGTLNTADYIMFRNQRWDFTVTGGEVRRTGNHIALAFRSGSNTTNATTTAEGAMTVAGGLVNNAGFLITIGQQNDASAKGTGHLNLNAGTLITNQILHYNGAGSVTTARVNFNGGLLRASANSTAFLGTTGSGGTGSLNVYVNGAFGGFSGGAVIDSNGFNVAITTGLLAPTGDGVSSIALTSGGGGYSGAPYVEISGGGGSGATATATVDLDPASSTFGQVLSITVTNPGVGYTSTPSINLLGGGGSGAVVGTVSTAANTSGGLVKNGAGILTLGAASTYTGGTTINAGTLALGVDNALAATGAVTISGGTFDLNTRSNTVGTVTLQSGAITGTTGVLTSTSDFQLQGGSVSASLAGGVGLQKTTSGTVTLTGVNTFSGAVNVTGGVLAFSSISALGTGNAVTVNGGTLSYTGSDPADFGVGRVLTLGASGATLNVVESTASLTVSGGLQASGSGALTKTGAGAVLLSGTTDLNGGALQVSAGTLQAGFGTDGISALTIGAGAVMDFSNNAAQALAGLGGLTLGDGAKLVFELNGGSNDSLASLLAATATGTIVVEVASIGAGLSEVTYNLISASSGLSAASFVLGNGISGWNLSLVTTDSLVSVIATALQTRHWRGGADFSWNTLANWSSDAAGLNTAPQTPGAASHVIFSTGSAPFSSGTQIVTTLDAAFTINSLRFESAPAGVTAITIQAGTGGVLTLAPQTENSGIEVLPNAGAVTLAAPVVASTAQTWSVADSGASMEVSGGLTFSQVITKTGAGSLTLSGNNSGSGGLVLQSGRLNLNSATALGTGLLTVSAGTILDNTSGSAVALGGATYLWGGNFVFTGTNALHLGSGAVTLADNVTVDTAAGSLTVGGVISSGTDSFGLVKTGAGTLTLGAANTYLGGTVLNQGALVYTASQNVSTLTFGSAAGSTSVGSLDLSAASLTVSGAALVQTNSTNHNTITIGSGQTLRFNGSFVVGYDSAFVTKTRLTISGAGTFKIGDVGAPTNASVQVGNSLTTSVSNAAVLDMSGLAVFYANLGTGTFRIGDISNGGGGAGAGGGGSTVILAPDSTLIAATISLDSNTLITQTLSLGAGTNLLQANQFFIGGVSSRGQGVLNFHTTTGSVVVRDRAGTGRAIMNVQNGGSGTAGTLTGLADFSGHHADLLLSTLGVGGRSASTGIGTGTFIFDTGVLDAQTVTLASRTSTTVTTSNITGTMTLGGTTAETSVTFGTVTMATNTATTANSTGNAIATLNISGLGTTSIGALNMGVLGLTGASAGTGAGAGTTATVNISGSTTTLGSLNFAVNNSTATGATTATSALNISGGSVSVTGGVNLGSTSGNALNVVNNSITLTGGTLSVGGSITHTNGAGTENVSVTLNGGALDMNGHAIGAADATVAFHTQSGTLRDLGELNGGGVLTKSTAGLLVVEGTSSHTGGTHVGDGVLQLGTGAAYASLTGSGLVSVVKTGATLANAPVLAGGGLIAGAVTVGDAGSSSNRGVLALGYGDTAASNTTLVVQGAAGLTIAGGSQLRLSLTNATTNDAGILAALGAGAYVNALDHITSASPAWVSGGPVDMADHDFLQITGGLQLGARNGGGTVAVLDNGYLATAQSGDVFNLLDWAGLMSGSFASGSGFTTGGAHGDFDLPTLTGGLVWDTSAFTTHGVIVVVPEPSIMQFAFAGLAALLLRRRRR